MMKFFSLLVFTLLLLGNNQAHAFLGFGNNLPVLRHLHQSIEFITIIEDLKQNPDALKDADSKERLVFPGPIGEDDYAVDLMLSDIIDQVHFGMYKKKMHAERAILERELGTKPLENFLKWNEAIDRIARTSPKLRRILSRVVVQVYKTNGTPQSFKLKLFRAGRWSRASRRARVKRYQELLNDPEGSNIARFIRVDRELKLKLGKRDIFPTTRLTVTKYMKYKKKYFNKEYRKRFYEQYFKLIRKQEKIDHETLPDVEKVLFKYKFKAKKGEPVKIRSKRKSEKDFKNVTTQLFNTINALPYKQGLLGYIKSEMENKWAIDVPVHSSFKTKHIILSPSFIHQYRKKLVPIIKEFTYIHLYSTGDMEYMLHLRKWVRKNYDEIEKRAAEKDLPFTIKKRTIMLPRVAELVENFQVMRQLFPDNPWDKKLPVIYDESGKPVYLKGRMMRFILKARDFLKKLVSIENVSSLIVGGVVFAATGNPMLSAMAGSLVRDAVRIGKYDLDIKEQIPFMLKNVAISAILGAGFTSGRLAEQIILGGIVGAAESAIIRRRVDVGAIVGAIQGVLTGLLPRSIAHPTVSGLGADAMFKNALIELLETSVYRGIHGLVVSLITSEDAVEGLTRGLVYGLGEAGLKIAIYGFRYRPNIKQEDLDLENEFQQGRGAGTYNMDMQLVDDTFFRKDGLMQMFYDRTWTFGNQVISDPSTPGDTGVETHEMSHRAQNRSFGIIGFNTRYVLEFFKNGSRGANVFENYRYLPHTHTPLCAPLHATPAGLKAFEAGLGTAGGVRNN